jgi:hypothetical protein
MPQITELPELVAALPASARARIERLYYIARVHGYCRVPASMHNQVLTRMGSLADIEKQTVLRVTNVHTWDGALFNPLRGKRPLQMAPVAEARNTPDIFAEPLVTTATDVFGRVRGAHCITTGNIARWDGQCAVEIFDEADPLAITREHLRDYFRTALAWAHLANQADPAARYFIWMWNGGIKAGASIIHAHAQMGLGRGQHYARIESLRRAAVAYRTQFGTTLFDDMRAAHRDLGLSFETAGLEGFVNAPARAKDILLFGNAIDDALADAAYTTLRALIDKTGTGAFNMAVLAPPLFGAAHAGEDWSDFPVIVRLCDRGSPAMLSSDIGALDIFAHNTISADPFAIRQALGEIPVEK